MSVVQTNFPELAMGAVSRKALCVCAKTARPRSTQTAPLEECGMSNYIQPDYPPSIRKARDGTLLTDVQPHQQGSSGNPLHVTVIPRYVQPVSDKDDPHHIFH